MKKKIVLFLILSVILHQNFIICQETKGEWILDKISGCKVWNPNPVPNESIKWFGGWVDGLAHGYGVLWWYLNDNLNGKYEGEMKYGKKNGYGINFFPDGSKYKGYWEDNDCSGKGTFTWPDGSKYEGDWKNGVQEGHGVWNWSNGNRYEGNWENGVPQGHGAFTWSNGNKYEGNWKNGDQEGYGVFTWPNGDKYEGNWKNGVQEGYGTYIWADGDKYEGEWKNDNRDGQGIFTSYSGKQYKEYWENGKYLYREAIIDEINTDDIEEDESDVGNFVKGVVIVGSLLYALSEIFGSDSDSKSSSRSGSSSSSSAYSSSPSYSSSSGTLYVTVKSSGLVFDTELDRYNVKIRKTKNLNGKYDYGSTDEKTGSGTFWGEPSSFYSKSYGYYEIECSGYDENSRKIFHVKWSNIKHACSLTYVTVYSNSSMNPSVECN